MIIYISSKGYCIIIIINLYETLKLVVYYFYIISKSNMNYGAHNKNIDASLNGQRIELFLTNICLEQIIV